MRYGLALRHVSTLPTCFHSFQHSSICHRQRASTSASSTESSSCGTLVIRIVQPKSCRRALPVFLCLRCGLALARPCVRTLGRCTPLALLSSVGCRQPVAARVAVRSHLC